MTVTSHKHVYLVTVYSILYFSRYIEVIVTITETQTMLGLKRLLVTFMMNKGLLSTRSPLRYMAKILLLEVL